VLRRYTALAFAIAVPIFAASGCGGGDGNGNGGGGNQLSADEQLHVIQDRADIEEFCALHKAPRDSDLYLRGLTAAVEATGDLAVVGKRSPNRIFVEKITKTKAPLRQIVAQAVDKLSKCGKDGRTMAQKLRRATA
jgi:hypothetical protein